MKGQYKVEQLGDVTSHMTMIGLDQVLNPVGECIEGVLRAGIKLI